MLYAVSDIVRDVRVALDENARGGSLLEEGDIDTLELETLIISKIEPSAKAVTTAAPRMLLDRGEPFASEIGWKQSIGKGCGVVSLPDDFLRLVSFQMSDWAIPVTEPITDEMPQYALQTSRTVGLKGNPERPVAAIVHTSTGLKLEFYSCTEGENVTLRKARYIAVPRIKAVKPEADSDKHYDGIEICERLYDAVVTECALRVALALGEQEKASLLDQEQKRN